MPGNSPLRASSLKQMRQSPNSRINPLVLQQRQQRRTIRVEYFGFLNDLAICDFLAIIFD